MLRQTEVDRLADAGTRMAEINIERQRLGVAARPEEPSALGPVPADPNPEDVLKVQVGMHALE